MRDNSNRVMKMLLTDHFYMKRMLEKVQVQLSTSNGERSQDINSIAKALRFHIDYVLEAHCPVEDMIFAHLRERRPLLASAIDEFMIDHVKSETWLIAISDVCRRGDVVISGQEKRFVNLTLNYCTHKIAHIDKENHKIFPAIDAIFNNADWQKVEETADRILGRLESFTPDVTSGEKPSPSCLVSARGSIQ